MTYTPQHQYRGQGSFCEPQHLPSPCWWSLRRTLGFLFLPLTNTQPGRREGGSPDFFVLSCPLKKWGIQLLQWAVGIGGDCLPSFHPLVLQPDQLSPHSLLAGTAWSAYVTALGYNTKRPLRFKVNTSGKQHLWQNQSLPWAQLR